MTLIEFCGFCDQRATLFVKARKTRRVDPGGTEYAQINLTACDEHVKDAVSLFTGFMKLAG
jgi:hypothetical protein